MFVVSNQTKLENSNTELISLVKATVVAQSIEERVLWIPPMMLEMTFKQLYYSNHNSSACVSIDQKCPWPSLKVCMILGRDVAR